MAGLPQRPVFGSPSRPLIARPAAGLAPSPFANQLGQIAAQAASNSFSGHVHSPFAPTAPARPPTSSRGRGFSGPTASSSTERGCGRGASRGRGEGGRGRGRGASHAPSMPSNGPPYLPQTAQPVSGGPATFPSPASWTGSPASASQPMRYTEDGYGISATAPDYVPEPPRETCGHELSSRR